MSGVYIVSSIEYIAHIHIHIWVVVAVVGSVGHAVIVSVEPVRVAIGVSRRMMMITVGQVMTIGQTIVTAVWCVVTVILLSGGGGCLRLGRARCLMVMVMR